jgi:hypothetical protein
MAVSKVFAIRTAMVRRLDEMNMRSVLASEDNAIDRLGVEMAIRHCDGVTVVHYWCLDKIDQRIIEFRRSLKSWISTQPVYAEHVRIIMPITDGMRLIEAPLQLSCALDAWLETYWGLLDSRLQSNPSKEFLLKSYRASL